MYKAWFDGSYHKSRKLAVLGVYIENEQMDVVYSHSLFRKDLLSSSEAETFALLSLLEVIQKRYQNESFLIHGDDQSLIEKIKGKKIQEPLILSCLTQLKACNLKPSSIQWLERDYNKADPYTRIGENERTKSVLMLQHMANNAEEAMAFTLTNEAYKTYIIETKGNGILSKRVAEKKLNRNILRSKGKSFRLKDQTIVHIYFGMLIFTKDKHITKLMIEKGDAKGVLYYRNNMEILEEFNQKIKEEIFA